MCLRHVRGKERLPDRNPISISILASTGDGQSHRCRYHRRCRSRRRRQRFPVGRSVRRATPRQRCTAMHGAFSRERTQKEGGGGNLFLEAAQVGPYLLCLLNTPRFARGTQYPLLWIHSIILLPPLCRSIYLSLSLAQGGSRRLSSAHTHTYAQALRISFSLSPFLLPFHSSSVVSVSRATLCPLARRSWSLSFVSSSRRDDRDFPSINSGYLLCTLSAPIRLPRRCTLSRVHGESRVCVESRCALFVFAVNGFFYIASQTIE